MSQANCDFCPFESYNSTIWGIQNPWFREDSSLAGAMGTPHQQASPQVWEDVYMDAIEWHQDLQVAAFDPFEGLEGISFPASLGAGSQEAGWEVSAGHSTGGYYPGGYNQYGGSGAGGPVAGASTAHVGESDVVQPAELAGQKPLFCLFEGCLYWHINSKQVRRHRQTHFSERSGFWCPNQSGSCSQQLGYSFGREDAVKEHCKRFPACMASLQANNNVVVRWGVPGTAQDLVPYDPLFHKPYRSEWGRREPKAAQ